MDDRPFGGGEGMVLKPEPIFECVESFGGLASRAERIGGSATQSVIVLSPQGRTMDQSLAAEFSALERIVLICGRYEGVDERVSEHLADREVSIGDYVLSGGELGAAVILDTVDRLIPGAVGNEDSTRQESFTEPAFAGEVNPRDACGSEFDLRVRRVAGLSALHAARGFSRDGGAGSADEREPRRHSALASEDGSGEDAAQSSGSAGTSGTDRRRPEIAGRD